MIRCCRLGGLNDRNLFSYSSGGWKSKVRVSLGLVSPEAFLGGLQMATSSLCRRIIHPLCVCVQISSCKDKSHVGLNCRSLSHVQLFATPWTIDHQAPLSMGLPRQEWWSGLPCPSPGGSSPPRNQALVSCIAGRLFPIWATSEPGQGLALIISF